MIGDILDQTPANLSQFDVIIGNPPFTFARDHVHCLTRYLTSGLFPACAGMNRVSSQCSRRGTVESVENRKKSIDRTQVD